MYAYLGVDPGEDPYVREVALMAVCAPMPDGWEEVRRLSVRGAAPRGEGGARRLHAGGGLLVAACAPMPDGSEEVCTCGCWCGLRVVACGCGCGLWLVVGGCRWVANGAQDGGGRLHLNRLNRQSQVEDDAAGTIFVNQITGEATANHPLDDYYMELIRRRRKVGWEVGRFGSGRLERGRAVR